MEKSKGLGDSISKFTHATRLNEVAEAVARLARLDGCGCDERKQYLNELFPYENTSRRFKALKDFNHSGKNYTKGGIYAVDSSSTLYPVIIKFVEIGNLKEI